VLEITPLGKTLSLSVAPAAQKRCFFVQRRDGQANDLKRQYWGSFFKINPEPDEDRLNQYAHPAPRLHIPYTNFVRFGLTLGLVGTTKEIFGFPSRQTNILSGPVQLPIKIIVS